MYALEGAGVSVLPEIMRRRRKILLGELKNKNTKGSNNFINSNNDTRRKTKNGNIRKKN